MGLLYALNVPGSQYKVLLIKIIKLCGTLATLPDRFKSYWVSDCFNSERSIIPETDSQDDSLNIDACSKQPNENIFCRLLWLLGQWKHLIYRQCDF